jgi:hypothetical protein
VERHQWEKVEGTRIDAVTANMLVTVHDALNEKNQELFETIPLMRLIDFGWRQVKPKENNI